MTPQITISLNENSSLNSIVITFHILIMNIWVGFIFTVRISTPSAIYALLEVMCWLASKTALKSVLTCTSHAGGRRHTDWRQVLALLILPPRFAIIIGLLLFPVTSLWDSDARVCTELFSSMQIRLQQTDNMYSDEITSDKVTYMSETQKNHTHPKSKVGRKCIRKKHYTATASIGDPSRGRTVPVGRDIL